MPLCKLNFTGEIMNKSIPIVLVHGSLGSGKTTLIRELLAERTLVDALIIENEFASEDIDTQTLDAHRHGKSLSITGGCICCSSAEELEETLREIVKIKWDKPVIIETTGVASSAQLLQKLFLDQTFLEHFHIVRNIYVLDPLEITTAMLKTSHRLEAALADVIVINKSGLAADKTLNSLQDALAAINPHAKLFFVNRGKVNLSEIINQKPSNVEQALAEEHEALRAGVTSNNHELRYVVRELPWPIECGQFEVIMKKLAKSTKLLRCKGYFYDKGGVWWHYEATRNHHELKPVTPRNKALLVFIGKTVDSDLVESAGFKESVHAA
jgi:G3E family GTPase